MTTVHFVYPRDATRNSSPFCIGNEVGDRLARDYDVRFYGWRDQVTIEPKPGDILLGHPHWRRDSVFDRSVRRPGWARRILMAPYADDLRQVAYYDRHMDQCDLFLAITGNYWFNRVAESPLRRWLDLPEGRDDREGWEALRNSASIGPVGRAQAGGHLAGLDFELG